MNSIQKAVANALSFAHLAGMGRPKGASAKAEDDDDKKAPDREDDDEKDSKAKSKAKAEDDEPDDKKDEKKDAKAEDEDDEAKAEHDEPEEGDDDKKKSKKAKAEDDDKDEEMRGSSPAAAARRRERARCAAIFASPAAARNPVLAANLAFKGSMSRTEALGILEGTPAPTSAASASHGDRSARNPRLGAGTPEATNPRQNVAKGWDAAFSAVHRR